MPYIHFTDEQKLRANSVDLVEFLRRQGERLIPSGRDKRLASDHSITVRGNEWYDHESKEGGGAISFLQTYYGLPYQEAVKRLLDGEGIAYPQAEPPEPEERKEFRRSGRNSPSRLPTAPCGGFTPICSSNGSSTGTSWTPSQSAG